MSRFDIDWRYIRRYTLIPLCTVLVSAGLVIAGSWLHGEQESVFEQISVNQDIMHQDYDALVFRRRLVDRYHRRYEQFHDLGFVGRESRLDWIETMRQTSSQLILPSVSYAIEPQLKVIAPVESIMAGEEIQIHLSRLQLEIGLVHEIDLLRFFDELQRNAPGLIKVDECALTWQGEASGAPKVAANIQANCSILIFSVVTSDIATGVSTS